MVASSHLLVCPSKGFIGLTGKMYTHQPEKKTAPQHYISNHMQQKNSISTVTLQVNGFLQACLWVLGALTIQKLHNMHIFKTLAI